MELLGLYLIYGIICAAVAEHIAKRKNLPTTLYAVLGIFFGVVGIIVAAVATPGTPPPPKGMQAVQCARCNAVTNIPVGDPTFECWQCKRRVPM
ncbi:hypothetical protein [Mycolicibacterium gadium]|jgi:hypothetical protein|uniref:hypothetical protein n=1 Tax=Mycolicibacterium gadium TaxID=1794 RepID=UPI002FDE46B7